jgi:hypothetical protein
MDNRTNLQDLFDHARVRFLTDNWKRTTNKAVEYILDYLEPDGFSSAKELVQHLESASCAYGSWGQDTIYTDKILALLADRDWQDAINSALEGYQDATGEQPSFKTLNLESLVLFAVNWYAGEVASYIRSHDKVYTITLYKDEPWQEKHSFLFESDANTFMEKQKSLCSDFYDQDSDYFSVSIESL